MLALTFNETKEMYVSKISKGVFVSNIVFSTPDTQEKHAVVEWFSRIEEIPFGLRKSLGHKQEIFLNEKAEWDTDILVSSIVGKTMVSSSRFKCVKARKGKCLQKFFDVVCRNRKPEIALSWQLKS